MSKNNTVLITGGASGIGLALAERYRRAGDEVIICGRRAEKLLEAVERVPGLHTRVCDVSVAEERIALFEWVAADRGSTQLVRIRREGSRCRYVCLDHEARIVSKFGWLAARSNGHGCS